jgi:hypothetical protein
VVDYIAEKQSMVCRIVLPGGHGEPGKWLRRVGSLPIEAGIALDIGGGLVDKPPSVSSRPLRAHPARHQLAVYIKTAWYQTHHGGHFYMKGVGVKLGKNGDDLCGLESRG